MVQLSDFGNCRDIEGYSNYMVSHRGFVMNKKTLKITQGSANVQGYQQVGLSEGKVRKTHLIHALVARAFLDNPNGYDRIDHIDRNRSTMTSKILGGARSRKIA